MRTNLVGFTISFWEQEIPKLENSIPVLGVANVDIALKALDTAGDQFNGDVIIAEGMEKIKTFHDP